MPSKLHRLSKMQLLRLYSEVLRALREKKVVRSSNNPAADRAEDLSCRRFNLKLASKSTKGYDAIGRGKKYQIKSRRLTKENPSKLLGAIRNIHQANLDYLIAYVFNEDFTVRQIFKIPKKALLRLIKTKVVGYSKAQHGHVVNLQREELMGFRVK